MVLLGGVEEPCGTRDHQEEVQEKVQKKSPNESKRLTVPCLSNCPPFREFLPMFASLCMSGPKTRPGEHPAWRGLDEGEPGEAL